MADDAAIRKRLERLGLGMVMPSHGVSALGALVRHTQRGTSPLASVAVSPFVWDRFVAAFAGARDLLVPELLDAADAAAAATTRAPAAGASQAASSGLRGGEVARVLAMDAAARQSHFEAHVMRAVHTVLGSDVGAQEPLMAAGLDSLGAVELRNAVSSSVGMQLPGTLIFDYPSVSAIASFVCELALDGHESDAVDVSGGASSQPVAASREGDVAMSLAAAAGSTALLPEGAKGTDAVCAVPLDHWDVDGSQARAESGLPARFGSFLEGLASFDAHACGISHGEGMLMDPQQRMLLLQAHTILLKTLTPGIANLDTWNYTVSVGIAWTEHITLLKTFSELSSFAATSGALSVASGRISYMFNLQGPAMSVDTACSSSLVAASAGPPLW